MNSISGIKRSAVCRELRKACLSAVHIYRQFSGKEVVQQVYCCRRKAVALTFDDGHGNGLAAAQKLALHGVTSTFFVSGEWLGAHRAEGRKIWELGHELANHTWNHACATSLSEEALFTEIASMQKLLKEVTGEDNRLFRFPYGNADRRTIHTVNTLGLTAIGWSDDSNDWRGIPAQEIQKNILEREPAGGAIVLLHTSGKHTLEALDLVIPALRAEGYELVKVSDLLRASPFYRRKP